MPSLLALPPGTDAEPTPLVVPVLELPAPPSAIQQTVYVSAEGTISYPKENGSWHAIIDIDVSVPSLIRSILDRHLSVDVKGVWPSDHKDDRVRPYTVIVDLHVTTVLPIPDVLNDTEFPHRGKWMHDTIERVRHATERLCPPGFTATVRYLYDPKRGVLYSYVKPPTEESTGAQKSDQLSDGVSQTASDSSAEHQENRSNRVSDRVRELRERDNERQRVRVS